MNEVPRLAFNLEIGYWNTEFGLLERSAKRAFRGFCVDNYLLTAFCESDDLENFAEPREDLK